MCIAWGGVGRDGGEWIRGLGLGFTNPVGRGLGPGSGVVVLCLCEL